MSYEAHPLANLFPMMADDDVLDLAADIEQHGLREPVVITSDNLILDGRNRYRACTLAGIEPTFSLYRGPLEGMAAFVISLNLKRRHLNEARRAMVAGKLANLEHGQRQTGQLAAVPTQAEAAALLNVGERSVRRAREVLGDGVPELVTAVEQGKVSGSAGADIAALDHETQRAVLDRVESGEKPADVIRNYRAQGTGAVEWYTPGEYIGSVRQVLGGIDLDPASHDIAQRTVGATQYFTAETDGLSQPWRGRVFLNPPYAQPLIQHFVDKLVREVADERVTEAVLLTHNYTDTGWFHAAEKAASRICFTRGRIRFQSPLREAATPTQGQAFFYFGPRGDQFAKVFEKHGFVR